MNITSKTIILIGSLLAVLNTYAMEDQSLQAKVIQCIESMPIMFSKIYIKDDHYKQDGFPGASSIFESYIKNESSIQQHLQRAAGYINEWKAIKNTKKRKKKINQAYKHLIQASEPITVMIDTSARSSTTRKIKERTIRMAVILIAASYINIYREEYDTALKHVKEVMNYYFKGNHSYEPMTTIMSPYNALTYLIGALHEPSKDYYKNNKERIAYIDLQAQHMQNRQEERIIRSLEKKIPIDQNKTQNQSKRKSRISKIRAARRKRTKPVKKEIAAVTRKTTPELPKRRLSNPSIISLDNYLAQKYNNGQIKTAKK